MRCFSHLSFGCLPLPPLQQPTLLVILCSNYGFDPLGLCKNPEGLKRFTESEVIHCRWAMLGAAGCLGVEALGQGNWYDAPLWVSVPRPVGSGCCPAWGTPWSPSGFASVVSLSGVFF